MFRETNLTPIFLCYRGDEAKKRHAMHFSTLKIEQKFSIAGFWDKRMC
jgi:hypothetical protein